MGKLITNSPKPVVRVKVAQSDYKGIRNLAQTVHDLMLANVGTFVLPLPTSVNLQNDIDALSSALSLLGTKNNRGSTSALAAVKNAAFIVFSDLTQRASYVTQILDPNQPAAYQALVISLSGFAAKSKRSRIAKMQFVRSVRQSNTKQYPQTLRRVDWRKSLGLFKGVTIKSFNIYATNTTEAVTVFLTSTTATNYIVPATAWFPPDGTQVINSVRIHPVNARGEGNGFTIHVK